MGIKILQPVMHLVLRAKLNRLETLYAWPYRQVHVGFMMIMLIKNVPR
jgi:hypothetical protein